jgi:hypothetical protein
MDNLYKKGAVEAFRNGIKEVIESEQLHLENTEKFMESLKNDVTLSRILASVNSKVVSHNPNSALVAEANNRNLNGRNNRNIINENITDNQKNVIGNSYDSIRLTKAIDNSDLHISDNHIIGKAANKKSTKIPLGKTHF